MKKRFAIVTIMAVAYGFMLLASCKGEKKAGNFTITGNVPSQVSSEWIYLYTIKDNEPVVFDSARIENTAFCFKGAVPDTMTLVILHPGTLNEYPAVGWNLLLEEGQIVIDSSEQFASGTPLNDGFKDWMGTLYGLMMTGQAEAVHNFFEEHWSEHSGDFVGSFVLYNFSPFLEFPFVDSLAQSVPDDIRQISMLKPFFDQLESLRAMQPGSMFSDVSLTYVDDTPVALADIIGKGEWVLIDFWASWCGPCRQAMPELQSVVKKFKSLKVYGIAVSDEKEDTRRAIANLNIKWPVLSDTEGLSAKAYGINAIPAMILFSPDGKIAARDINVNELENILNEKIN